MARCQSLTDQFKAVQDIAVNRQLRPNQANSWKRQGMD